jgi:small subunit ribosomal protein S15
MYSDSKGKSHSTRPIFKRSPSWITYSPDEIEALIVKMAKDEIPPSLIGIKLRDEYGIPLVKIFLGKSIHNILKENNMVKEIPDDLELLVNRARHIQEHLRKHTSDRKNVRSLELVEAKIHHLSKRYKKLGSVPANWKYKSKVAQLT